MAMDRADYHPDWTAISRQIREQADNRCEFCGVANGVVGARDRRGDWHDEDMIHGMNSSDGESLFGDFPNMVRIVLTVAHLCHETLCYDPTHLRALCARCHLNWDRPRNLEKARETRRKVREAALAATGQRRMAL